MMTRTRRLRKPPPRLGALQHRRARRGNNLPLSGRLRRSRRERGASAGEARRPRAVGEPGADDCGRDVALAPPRRPERERHAWPHASTRMHASALANAILDGRRQRCKNRALRTQELPRRESAPWRCARTEPPRRDAVRVPLPLHLPRTRRAEGRRGLRPNSTRAFLECECRRSSYGFPRVHGAIARARARALRGTNPANRIRATPSLFH